MGRTLNGLFVKTQTLTGSVVELTHSFAGLPHSEFGIVVHIPEVWCTLCDLHLDIFSCRSLLGELRGGKCVSDAPRVLVRA
jgi:hypothetical protein